MSAKEIFKAYPESDKRLHQMAVHHRLASWMDICYPAALVVVATFCASLEQAVTVLGCVCYFGGTWYSYHGYGFFQSYKSIRQEDRLNGDHLSKLRRVWITRFVFPTAMSLIVGGFIIVGLQAGWFGK